MNRNPEGSDPAREGLVYFSRMAASISHEMKNVLAVISEIAGLFGDLGLAAQKGRVLDPAQLTRLSSKMAEQIQRADVIAKRLNRFAHSADEPLKEVNLWEELDFFCALSFRFVERRGFRLGLSPVQEPIACATDPFGLLLVLFLSLEIVMETARKDVALNLSVRREGGGVIIGLDGDFQAPALFSDQKKESLSFWLPVIKAQMSSPGTRCPLELSFTLFA